MVFDLTAIEWIATILAVVGIIKILVIVVNKKAWFDKVSMPMMKKPKAMGVVMLVLAAVVFYYLYQSVDIVTIFAVMAFTSLLVGFGMMSFAKDLGGIAKKVYSQKFGLSIWIYTLVWLALSFWVLYEVFF